MNTTNTCDHVLDDLADLVANDREAIARHSEHLATCDHCRDARHEATTLADQVAAMANDYTAPSDLASRVLAAIDREAPAVVELAKPSPELRAEAPEAPRQTPQRSASAQRSPAPPRTTPRRPNLWMTIGAATALAAGASGIYFSSSTTTPAVTQRSSFPDGIVGKLTTIARAAADAVGGVSIKSGDDWRLIGNHELIPAGAVIRTDDRTRAALELGDGTRLVLDHGTEIAFDGADPRKITMPAGRVVADVAHVEGRRAAITTPHGRIDVIGTRLVVTATTTLTSVQVVRGAVELHDARGNHDRVGAGEEGVIETGKLTVAAAPSLARELAWSELAEKPVTNDDVAAGLGALRAYKPGESRDRDWNLALAQHDVKVRIVGPVARTEITETFKNDSNTTLEGVYQFPLPPDAQIDSLELDVEGGFEQGAFVDKQRGAKIWQGVIDKATPKLQIARRPDEIIWVDGSWRDPALLDWKRGGRFELRIFPIPANGQRTIKIAYTQVVTPRGRVRQYTYPLAHSADGSTVANQFNVDVEVRGAAAGSARASGYQLIADPARQDVSAMTLRQSGFVPRGDLVIEYRPADGDAELRAWTYTGAGAAVAPDDKLAAKQNVGIDPKVVAAQRAVAADTRPTAVLALRPSLPRWRESKPRDLMIVIDSSQSMVGERFTRASQLAVAMVTDMDRRDRFTIAACDTECRTMGAPRAPSTTAASEARRWLTEQVPAGASDVVGSIRTASQGLRNSGDRERWVLYIGDGFATTGFRRVADVERAIASLPRDLQLTTIGIGGDADAAVLAAAARGGGGSYLAWLPGQSVKTAAMIALESTQGAQLRNATIELPSGLADVAPTQLPTVRSGEEVLIAARLTGEVQGDVVLKGTVGGQPFEQRYPVKLAVSSAAGNGFVPRLWASLAIEQLERRGDNDHRTQIVALSQGYGVMSRETSLLVLESAAMFEAFGVDRRSPAATWTGEDELDEVVTAGTIDYSAGTNKNDAPGKKAAEVASGEGLGASTRSTKTEDAPADFAKSFLAAEPAPAPRRIERSDDDGGAIDLRRRGRGMGMGAMAFRRTWVRTPALAAYTGVTDGITRAVANAEAALTAAPDSREKHRALVQALSYAGEIDRAREVASRWLERDKLDPQALGYLADLLGRDGQRELALRTLAGLVDLDPDRPALHERMVRAYESVGRMAQACSHRIALAALAPQDANRAGSAIRCLRTTGASGDAELVTRALADDAARAAAEKAAMVALLVPKLSGDLVVNAHWAGGHDLDISVV
ncbi:MAG: VIT domain-containing protein, partial [Kofleriaceae bacterium]